MIRWRSGMLAGWIAVVAACSINPAGAPQDFVVMSIDEEVRLGQEFHADILRQYGYYADLELQAYVQKIGEQLAARSRRDGLEYYFFVLDSPRVNAFALPGGYVYVTRGLLAYLNSEAQLAAVLGHEIGHVVARHGVRQVSAARATGLDLAGSLNTVLVQGYGRDQELEADRLGAEYLARAGYDPQAMIGMISGLKAQQLFDKRRAAEAARDPRAYHGVFASYPKNDTRLRQVVAAAEQFKSDLPVTVSRQSFLERLDDLVFGDSEREGIRRGNRYYHAELNAGLDFPIGWRVENRADSVVGMSRDRAARLVMTVEDIKPRMVPEDFIYSRFRLDELDVLEDEREIYGRGLEGYSGVADIGTVFGVRRARIATIYYNGAAYVFVGFARHKNTLEKYDEEFNRAIDSFRPLNIEERALAKASRLRLHKVRPGETIATLAVSPASPHYAEERLRLLNGYGERRQLVVGEIIKVVQ